MVPLANCIEIAKFVPAPLLVGVEPNPGPGSGEKLTEEQRWSVVIFKKEMQWTNKKIAQKVKCREQTVHDVWEKYQETGTVHDRPKSGRKRKLSDSESKQMAKEALKGKAATEIARDSKKSVSARTVRRALHREGLVNLKIQKIEALSPRNQAKRLEYAREMEGFEWKRVLFSDEKTFYLTFTPLRAWNRPGHRIQAEVPKWPEKIHVWGAIGYYFKTNLYFFTETMNAPLYQKIIQARLVNDGLIFSDDCPRKLAKNWYFLQDNDPKHKAKQSMELLHTVVGDNLIEHPSNSPDLNVIEDAWSYLVRKLENTRVKTLHGLKLKIRQEWDAMPWSEIRKSVNSMPTRLERCIELHGARTQY
jgi:transposase